jgi:23S rRNA pseudouridine1911/1915/1917 synthase
MSLFPKDRDLATSLETVELTVRASDYGLRLDDVDFRLDSFLAHHLHWRSRTSIQRLIRDGSVLVHVPTPDRAPGEQGGEPVRETRVSRRLRHGSRVVIVIPEELRVTVNPWATEDLSILYEDEACLAVDKPPGLAVHPAGRHLSDTLVQRVHARYRTEPGERVPIKLCHRLDRETSGVVLLAKDSISHTALMKDFEHRRVGKEYLAVVRGVPDEEGGVIELPLAPARYGEIRIKMAVASDGMHARTDWKVLERHEDCALVRCTLHTGRQHQIRVHLDAVGYPLVGDKLYGVEESIFLRNAQGELEHEDFRRLGLPRHALHAHTLEFTTPATGERVRVEAPLPEDLRAYLDGARSVAP